MTTKLNDERGASLILEIALLALVLAMGALAYYNYRQSSRPINVPLTPYAHISNAKSGTTYQSNVKPTSNTDGTSRDEQREKDLSTVQKALDSYFIDNYLYPASLSQLTTGSSLLIKSIPADPLNKPPYTYTYTSSNTNGTAQYTLDACLEDPNVISNNNSASSFKAYVVAAVPPCKTKTLQFQGLQSIN